MQFKHRMSCEYLSVDVDRHLWFRGRITPLFANQNAPQHDKVNSSLQPTPIFKLIVKSVEKVNDTR